MEISSYILSYWFSFNFNALINFIEFLRLFFFNKWFINDWLSLIISLIENIFSKGADLNNSSIISLLIYLSATSVFLILKKKLIILSYSFPVIHFFNSLFNMLKSTI